MCIELDQMGLKYESEVPLPIEYRGIIVLEEGYRLDLLVENQIVIELKSVEEVKPIHHKQLLTYLQLSHKAIGLLLNFNVPLMKKGITRVRTRDHLADF